MSTSKPLSNFQVPPERLYELARELTSDLELRSVLRRVMTFALDTVGGTAGSMVVLDEQGEVVSAVILHAGRMYENTTMQMRQVLERGLAGWVAEHRWPALVPDTTKDDRWLSNPYPGEESRSAISAPLLVKEHLVGVLTVVHREPNAFNEQHLAWVQAIADFAGAAVMNALMYARSRRQARLMRVWAESAMTITSTLQADEVIRRMLRQVEHALRVEAVLLALADEHAQTWVVTDASGVLADRLLGLRLPGPEHMAPTQNDEDAPCPSLEPLKAFNTRAVACAPMLIDDKAIGALIAVNPLEGKFCSDMEDLLRGLASMASTALRHARLFEDLRSAHQQYRDLFNDTLDWIFITDLQGRVIEANRQAKVDLGYTWEELRAGTLPISMVHTLPEDILPAKFEDIPNTPPITYESEVRAANGDYIPVEVYVRRVSLQGKPHLQWILRDITERKRLATLKDDLLAMTYHDLRSPLGSIAMSLELLQQVCTNADDPTVSELFSIALHAADRLHRLTSNLLDIHRIEAGQLPLEIRPLSPAKLVNDAAEAVQPQLAKYEHTLEKQVEDGLPDVLADHDMVRRVLINLLENAIKYTPSGGHIVVGAAREGENKVRFWVTDNGPGISEEDQKRIFNKYARGTRSQGKGLGLGLAFARLAIQAHGGEIGVHSRLGEGATFYFTLPVAPPSSQTNPS
ncbi:MAG: GAF domain-containing protein [Chloroflexi bacterium]|nr:GAF domain-containing protein [Chloroflexota bacterium]